MSAILEVTPYDPLVARDGRPFGANQGNRMHGLNWLLPSVVAGSLRTAIVKFQNGNFAGDVPQQLMQIAVAGIFPSYDRILYFPAPMDCVVEPATEHRANQTVHRVAPILEFSGNCDMPDDLKPVMLPLDVEDFKPAEMPTWWPADRYIDWLLGRVNNFKFDTSFLKSPVQETRDHVKIDPNLGAAEKGQIFSTTGLNLSHMPRYGTGSQENFEGSFAGVTLSVRVHDSDSSIKLNDDFCILHSLGGERRLVHWRRQSVDIPGWRCPDDVRLALQKATRVRLILATPAIFRQGWRPDIESGPLREFGLTLVGATIGRWKAISGWSLAKINDQGKLDPYGRPGPKPIRRMVPAGSVYFFETKQGAAEALAHKWLESVSDDEQERRDGFGLALWGTW